MRVAIIGGGASGLITAYLLASKFDVHIFEKSPLLGGNVRTLNGNVPVDSIEANLRLENGVLGFHKSSYPVFHRLLETLNVGYTIKQPSTSLFRHGLYFPSNPRSFLNRATVAKMIRHPAYGSEYYQLLKQFAPILRKVVRSDPHLPDGVGAAIADREPARSFVKSLLSLAYSTPYANTDILPVGLAAPYLRSLSTPDWSRIDGGVSTYQEAICAQSDFTTHLDQGDVRVTRKPDQIVVHGRAGDVIVDKVIVATTPGAVRHVLRDADATELACFGPWQDHLFKTISHRSLAPYGAFKNAPKSPMDLFLNTDGISGYNTYLNGFYDLPPKHPYSFAYGLDPLISRADVLNTQNHAVPTYTPSAYAQRKAISALNGRRDTYFVGAYLGNGLHEGAVRSAIKVSQLLGGDTL